MRIRIITGEKDSGKSTNFLALYQKEQKGIAFYSKKQYDNQHIVSGYSLVILPYEITYPFIERCDNTTIPTEESYHQGAFAFRKETFQTAFQYIIHTPNKISEVWIDEVGKLELEGKGFSPILSYLLEFGIDMTLVIRKIYLQKFFDNYFDKYIDSIRESKIITCNHH